jgi:hypothetical protein
MLNALAVPFVKMWPRNFGCAPRLFEIPSVLNTSFLLEKFSAVRSQNRMLSWVGIAAPVIAGLFHFRTNLVGGLTQNRTVARKPL